MPLVRNGGHSLRRAEVYRAWGPQQNNVALDEQEVDHPACWGNVSMVLAVVPGLYIGVVSRHELDIPVCSTRYQSVSSTTKTHRHQMYWRFRLFKAFKAQRRTRKWLSASTSLFFKFKFKFKWSWPNPREKMMTNLQKNNTDNIWFRFSFILLYHPHPPWHSLSSITPLKANK